MYSNHNPPSSLTTPTFQPKQQPPIDVTWVMFSPSPYLFCSKSKSRFNIMISKGSSCSLYSESSICAFYACHCSLSIVSVIFPYLPRTTMNGHFSFEDDAHCRPTHLSFIHFASVFCPSKGAIKPHGLLKIKERRKYPPFPLSHHVHRSRWRHPLLPLSLSLSHPIHVTSWRPSLARIQEQSMSLHSSLCAYSLEGRQTKNSFFGSVVLESGIWHRRERFATIPFLTFFFCCCQFAEARFNSSMVMCPVCPPKHLALSYYSLPHHTQLVTPLHLSNNPKLATATLFITLSQGVKPLTRFIHPPAK